MTQSLTQRFAQAQRMQQQGALKPAIQAYEQLLALAPNPAEIHRCLGLCYAEIGNMDKAIQHFQQAITFHPDDHSLHNNLGNAYKNNRAIDLAIDHYQQALSIKPDYAQAHNNLAAMYALHDHYPLALRHYRAAVHAAPDFTAAHFNLGLLLLKHHEPQAAMIQFNNVLALQPDHPDAHFYLGILHLDSNSLEAAKASFEATLAQHSEHIDAIVNLGVIALKRDQGQLAVDYFTKALLIDEQHAEARNNLAATFIHYDRYENALMHYDVLLKQDPRSIEYHYNSGVAQMALGHLNEARKHFETILAQQPAHCATLTNLAAVHSKLGDRDGAVVLLKRAVINNPDDQASQFMLKAMTGTEHPPQACPDYITNLFDHYALSYDQHMQNTLHYTLPFQIAQILHQLLGETRIQHAVDLGCGTGLVGSVMKSISDDLTGVDLSAKMLARAKEKGIYDQLITAEILTFLQRNQQTYQLAVATDVLPYFGELDTLLSLIKSRLSAHGLFVFSTEINTARDWALQSSGRFSHNPQYIHSLCAQHHFDIIHQDTCTARMQDGQPLPVMIYALKNNG